MHATLTARVSSLLISTLPGPFTCIFFQNLSRVFPVLAVGNTGSCVGPQNKGAHPAHRYGQLMRVSVLTDRGISVGCKHVLPYGCFSVFAVRNCGHNFDFLREIDVFYEM